MPTVNERIFDLSVRHQVGVQRLSAGILKRLLPLLDRADAEIVDQLLKRTATLEGSFTSQRLQYLLAAIRDINRDANIELANSLRSELRDLAKHEAGFQATLIAGSLPKAVVIDVVTPTASLLNAVVTNNPIQGRFLRDWLSDLSKNRQKRIAAAIRQGMIQGEGVDQIVRRIRGTRAAGFKDGVLNVNRRQAQNLVRTAVNSVSNAAREVLYGENSDIIKGVQWVATLDPRTCPICAGYDGKVFAMNNGPRPPAHPSCRCATVPVTKSWRELGINADELPPGTRASINGQVAESMNFADWLNQQSAEVQNEALGPTRGRLFRSGGLSIDRFTDSRGNIVTLDQLAQSEADAFSKAGFAA